MHTVLVSIISVLIVLGIMVLVHEFGHFLAAKLCGVRVEQFSIGFPPRLFGIKIGETDYCISAIPLGGFVKMTGESMPGENLQLSGADGETIAAQKLDPGALTSHPRWQRIIIGLSGPFSNFVLALVLMTGFYMLHHEVEVYKDQPVTIDWVVPDSAAGQAGLQSGDRVITFDNQPNPTWFQMNVRAVLNMNHSVNLNVIRNGQEIPLTLQLNDSSKGEDFSLEKLGLLPAIQPSPLKVSVVTSGSPAGKAGIQPGDIFESIDGHIFHGTASIFEYLQSKKGAPINVVVDRNGAKSAMTIQPIMLDAPPQGRAWRIGFQGAPPPYKVERLPLPEALQSSAKFCRANSLLIFEVLQRLVSHRISVDSLSGPIGIAQQTGQAWEMPGWGPTIQLMTVISLNLGVLNLLPFPILDGGMIVFLLIESVMRRDVNVMVKERIYQVGFVLIIIFFGYVIFNDISKLNLFSHLKM
jgi:regulator of sigma E protease